MFNQYKLINGYQSSFADVQFGVPQGTVLGPLVFYFTWMIILVYRMLFHTVNIQHDYHYLQSHFDLIIKWIQTRQMGLNFNKCVILTCSRLLFPSSSVYTIYDQPITHGTQHPYLTVLFDCTMSSYPILAI